MRDDEEKSVKLHGVPSVVLFETVSSSSRDQKYLQTNSDVLSDDKRYKNESEMDSDMNEEPQTTRYKPDADDEYSGKKSI